LNNKEKQKAPKEADWYDDIYKQPFDYQYHYTQSRYYFLWSVIGDRMIRSGVRRILDLGCGPGQFASFLYDKGLKDYCGLDFSQEAIAIAKRRCPFYEFVLTDIRECDILEVADYDCVVALEFLEHVDRDTKIIERIRPKTKFYGTVPNFPYISHVRHFLDEGEVRSRYHHFFSYFHVDKFLQNLSGMTYYLIEGIKSS